MKGNAIQLVGEEIAKRIEASGIDPKINVYFGPLDVDDAISGDPRLILFPYRVSVNADLRNTEHRVPALVPDPHGGIPVVRDEIYDEALPLDVHFVLCGRPTKPIVQWQGPDALGTAMQRLNDPASRFGLLVEGELVHLSLDTVSTEEMGRIWSLFPAVNYRTSVVYLASPVWIDPQHPRETGTPVVHEKYLPRPAPIVERA
ncbi:Pvc16 family protein [Mesorhizobium sp. M0011]|uniref:Pvc16 family protein n=1 Tax=Mesorhizobium sp. M0011 TaxID=2956839 RepID=UPI00333BDDBA